jgi:Zn-dependent M32 family carboxypeptidase
MPKVRTSERSALQSLIDKRTQEADATKKLIDSLNLGDLSSLSPEQKYLEAQRQFDKATTVDEKNTAAQALKASRDYNGSTEAYGKDYAKVQGILATQLASQKSAAAVAQKQLDALDKMAVDVLGLNKGTDALTKAVVEFQKVTLELGAAMIALAGANAGCWQA